MKALKIALITSLVVAMAGCGTRSGYQPNRTGREVLQEYGLTNFDGACDLAIGDTVLYAEFEGSLLDKSKDPDWFQKHLEERLVKNIKRRC